MFLPYFFSYKTRNFPLQNNPKNLDLSYKTDLDFWDCFWKGNTHLLAAFHEAGLDIWGHLSEMETQFLNQRNTVCFITKCILLHRSYVYRYTCMFSFSPFFTGGSSNFATSFCFPRQQSPSIIVATFNE